jgi:DNA-directed RNA polymerase subunit N (RpoN/RPB10)
MKRCFFCGNVCMKKWCAVKIKSHQHQSEKEGWIRLLRQGLPRETVGLLLGGGNNG